MQSEIQALREELSRQRTELLSANHHHQQHSHYEDELKQLETRLQSAQLEIDFYKKLIKEAYSRFRQLSSTVTTSSQQSAQIRKIVDEWLSMFEAVSSNVDSFTFISTFCFPKSFLIKTLVQK